MFKYIKSRLKKIANRVLASRQQTIVPLYTTFDWQRFALINKLDIQLAIDAGANIGQWAELTRKLGFKGKIHSFEPDSRAYSTLLRKQKLYSKDWFIYNFALGEINSNCAFNAWEVEGGSSSLLKLTKEGESFTFHKNSEISVVDVDIKRLDSIFDAETIKSIPALLKIDVQGYEKPLLDGCGEILSLFQLIEIEIPILDLYEGATLLPELLIYLREKGFILSTIQTDRFSNFGAADVDALFIRKDVFEQLAQERAQQATN